MTQKTPALERAYWTVSEVATKYGWSRTHVYALVQEGQIQPILKNGRSIRIPAEALRSFEEQNTGTWAEIYGAS